MSRVSKGVRVCIAADIARRGDLAPDLQSRLDACAALHGKVSLCHAVLEATARIKRVFPGGDSELRCSVAGVNHPRGDGQMPVRFSPERRQRAVGVNYGEPARNRAADCTHLHGHTRFRENLMPGSFVKPDVSDHDIVRAGAGRSDPEGVVPRHESFRRDGPIADQVILVLEKRSELAVVEKNAPVFLDVALPQPQGPFLAVGFGDEIQREVIARVALGKLTPFLFRARAQMVQGAVQQTAS